MVTPGYLLPGAIIGAALVVFSIISFDLDRLSARRVWIALRGTVTALLAGLIAAGAIFGPLFLIGVVDAVESWMERNWESSLVLLLGGGLYGVPVGVVLGVVIGIAIVSTERWSLKPVVV